MFHEPLSVADALASLRTRKYAKRSIQGVEYHHARLSNGGDLFLTGFGLPFATELQPENWLVSPWFEANRFRLRGTSAIYRVQSRPVQGRSLDLIVRFSRVGQDIPADTMTRDHFTHVSFNSPFEEFATVMALRAARVGPRRRRIPTKRPLAIYSPPTRLELWQSGRSETQMAVKQAQCRGIRLDIGRPYILLYGWIRGIDIQEAVDHYQVGGRWRDRFLVETVAEVERDLSEAGFHVMDMKPAHIIVRFTRSGELVRHKDGHLAYALIDYELLEPRVAGLATGSSPALSRA